MAFDKNKQSHSVLDDEDDDDFLGFNLEEDENSEEENMEPTPRKRGSSVKRQVDESSKNNTKTIIIVCVSIAVAVCIIIGIILVRTNIKNKKLAEEQAKAEQEALAKQAETDETVKAGAPNLMTDTTDQNTTKPSSSDNITTDLNKQPVDTQYKIKSIKSVRDFINYEKFRAKTADGLEFYWLEATYKERPYKVQVPFKIFKELETKGTTIVDVEVTTLEDGSEIVTYMSVVENSKSLINKDKK